MGGDPEAVGPERDGAVFFPQDLRGGESTGGPLGGTGQSLQWAPGASSGGERAGQQVLWSWGSREESVLQGLGLPWAQRPGGGSSTRGPARRALGTRPWGGETAGVLPLFTRFRRMALFVLFYMNFPSLARAVRTQQLGLRRSAR